MTVRLDKLSLVECDRIVSMNVVIVIMNVITDVIVIMNVRTLSNLGSSLLNLAFLLGSR